MRYEPILQQQMDHNRTIEMVRRFGRNGLFISVPIFVLLLINYNYNIYHGYIPQDTQVNGTLADTDYMKSTTIDLPIAVATTAMEHQMMTSQWKVLQDGTVIHLGSKNVDYNYTFRMIDADRCSSLRANESSFVIVVETDIVNFDERQLIRETWGLDVMQELANYRVIFMVGLGRNPEIQNKLDYERIMYGDIVQIDVNEDFQNLTHKSIHMLYWYSRYCGNSRFLFKTDDDIYLHIPNMVNMFRTIEFNGSILCHQNKSRKIIRNFSDLHFFMYSYKNRNKQEVMKQIRKKFHKYLIGYDILPGSLYPNYCSGFGYSMNRNVAEKLLEASEKIPYIGIEDVFITGFCRQKCNITIMNNVNFRLKPYIFPIEGKCAFENGRITSNEMSKSDIRKLWTHVNSQGYYCKLTPQ